MLIDALCNYYDVINNKGLLPRNGFSTVDIKYIISLTKDGIIDGIIDCQISEQVEKGGKTKTVKRPKTVEFPKRYSVPGLCSETIECRGNYIFGLEYETDKSKNGILKSNINAKAEKSKFHLFISKNKEFINGLSSPVIDAFRLYMENWNPEEQTDNVHLLGLKEELNTAKFAFCLSGHPENLLNDDEKIKQKWADCYKNKPVDDSAVLAECAVIGQTLPLALTHDKIIGVPGGQSSGTCLICFNNSADESYSHKQSINSNISEKAMLKYTAALNYLIKSDKHKTVVDDVLIVHWAANGNTECDSLLTSLTLGNAQEDTDVLLKDWMLKLRSGKLTKEDLSSSENIDTETDYYIVGIKANVSRLSVKFVYKQKAGDVLINAVKHQSDIQIGSRSKPISIGTIINETISPEASSKSPNPALFSKLLDSVIYGYKYPYSLLQSIVTRVKTDSDGEKANEKNIKMNDVRLGIIKGYINRDSKKEEIKLALDETNQNPAYLCGRLFAVLESIQLKAQGKNLNRTIKDSYFAAASTTPASVFPKLLRLSQYHLSKLEHPQYGDMNISEIVALLGDSFPTRLLLPDQGRFMLGYYQQKNYQIEEAKKAKEEK